MKKRRLHIPIEAVVTVVLVAAILGGVLFAYWHDEGKRKAVAGVYSNEYQLNGGENSIVVKYVFDAAEGTYEELWDDTSLMTGAYEVKDNVLTVVTDGNEDIGAESETIRFFVENDTLIPEDYVYEGEIPDGGTFDAAVTLTDSAGTVYTVDFKKNGTFTYTVKSGSDESTVNFTYEREGDFIHRRDRDGNELSDFYIYQGRLAGVCYYKEKES